MICFRASVAFSLGLERTGGFETVAFCEIEDYPRRVLAKHWPEVPCYHDVRELTGARLAADGIAVDVICGGFPCQDVAVAGKGAGLAGERSGLWREYARLVGELRPDVVIVENVAALLGRGLGDVLGDLAAIGYDAEWHCIPACAVGAPHRRDRVWIIANANSVELRQQPICELRRGLQAIADADGAPEQVANAMGDPDRQGLAVGEGKSGDDGTKFAPSFGTGWWHVEPNVGRVANGVPAELDGGLIAEEHDTQEGAEGRASRADLRGLRRYGQSFASPSRLQQAERVSGALPEVPHQGRSKRRSPKASEAEAMRIVRNDVPAIAQQEALSMQRFVPLRDGADQCPKTMGQWVMEPDTPRVAAGVKNRVSRLRGIGNAVVPQIPELIGNAILKAMRPA